MVMNFPEGLTSLFVVEIGEPAENTLRILVAEAMPGSPSAVSLGDVAHEGVRPVEITEQSRYFELFWNDYVAYFVRNESFLADDPSNPAVTEQLNRQFNSAFLDFVSATTFADDDYPGPLQHWTLNAFRYCVDVVGVQPPTVQQVIPKIDYSTR